MGSNTGVGFEISRQLLDQGLSRPILAVRNEDEGNAAMAKLFAGRNLDESVIEVWRLDLSVYGSLVSFAERASKGLERLDIVVFNAGIRPANRVFNAHTGHDELILVNYLSTAFLAVLPLPITNVKRANQPHPSRITMVSSEVSAWTNFQEKGENPLLLALDQPGEVDMLDRMFVSKLLGQLFLSELARRVPPSVAVVHATSPGSVHDSEFKSEQDKTFTGVIAKIVMRRIVYTSASGAYMITDAAVKHGKESHGQFLSFQKMVLIAPIVYTPEGKTITERL